MRAALQVIVSRPDISNAQASVEEDRVSILARIEESVGVERLNECLKQASGGELRGPRGPGAYGAGVLVSWSPGFQS